ncbi:Apoptosis-inducing factor 2 [Hypsizygus marmoreus]|uniref:Apoptosis-inducing factor 2 n=1 Tax=Hypsizygus marmoreus TaxID=39966 RepID=A0A369J1C8_HYPMA|nr:Apoptosis-inducing factor 2 [Hypsizygus marmoreus]
MVLEYAYFIPKFLGALGPYMLERLSQRIAALIHKRTYVSPAPGSNPKIVIVIGGSFTGIHLARQLSHTLPTGYRVVLIEKHSHLNYLFSFPRFSVVEGHESKAFIPYPTNFPGAPEGVFARVQDTAVSIDQHTVTLASGETLEYEFLALTTGCTLPPPANVRATEKKDGCAELRAMQANIKGAKRVAVLGGGAVGVQLASDIKSFYPEKEVVLVHSHQQLLGRFGAKLHECALKALEELGVEVVLGKRPKVPKGGEEEKSVRLEDGEWSKEVDLVIPCTGQSPNSDLITSLSPSSISPTTHQVLVKPTLQLADDAFPHIFALGDVANTGGVKMARAGMAQAEVARRNIVRLIKGVEGRRLERYKPNWVEGALKLSLGKDRNILYLQDGKWELILKAKAHLPDMGIGRIWKYLGVKPGDWDL